jgi:hypothetical protein
MRARSASPSPSTSAAASCASCSRCVQADAIARGAAGGGVWKVFLLGPFRRAPRCAALGHAHAYRLPPLRVGCAALVRAARRGLRAQVLFGC